MQPVIRGKLFIFDASWRVLKHLSQTIQKIELTQNDMVMKMQAAEPAFVDGLYAKFYSLSNELLRVGPKCSSSSAPPDSFHPAEAVAGREEQPAFL